MGVIPGRFHPNLPCLWQTSASLEDREDLRLGEFALLYASVSVLFVRFLLPFRSVQDEGSLAPPLRLLVAIRTGICWS